MSTIRKYLIVDDDPQHNIIGTFMIELALGIADIKTFELPEEALTFILNNYTKNATPTIIFLDINMPTLTGWEFLEQYEKFSEEIKKQISIYVLSSSVDQRDMDKAETNKYIKGFISKPLDQEIILSIAGV